jgi:16S rRNA (cytosine1402-N4)-methyltransferase
MLPNVLRPNATDHVPVLADQVREALAVQPGETVVDATFGAGGHSELLAADLRGSGKLIAIDRDPSGARTSTRVRKRTGAQGRFHRASSDVCPAGRQRGAADAILFDLGAPDGHRPARLHATTRRRHATDPAPRSARELVNESGERELTQIFRDYGEERYARPIARAIVRRRREQPFERTGELVETIKSAIPAPARFGEGHPAKRVFQALRIAVNDELGSLEVALPEALEMLRPGGRLAVISFHSLEDRIVKRFLRSREKGCTCPPDFPVCVCGNEPELRALSRRPIKPTGRARFEPSLIVRPSAGGGQDRRRGITSWPPGATPHPRFPLRDHVPGRGRSLRPSASRRRATAWPVASSGSRSSRSCWPVSSR